MTEAWLAVRDSIGLHSTVVVEGEQTLIQDLPKGLYNLVHNGEEIASKISPNIIPGTILEYCGDLVRAGRKDEFKGEGTLYELASSLEIQAQRIE